jgi:hypothetical protein
MTGHAIHRSETAKNADIKDPAFTLSSKLSPMEELDKLIAAGYGDTPQSKIPKDWKVKPGPAVNHFRKW